ncbi:MAG: multidrug efflux MFS transporter [Turicibacter sp.]|nr:multidrug efflux MFS transporter [Turicibacter sp.]
MIKGQGTPLDIHGRAYNRPMMVALLMVATFAGVLMQTSLGTMIPTLMGEFGIDMSTAQQATTWFLLANGIMIPVTAFLATRFRTRWLYLAAYVALFLGMFMSFSAPTSNWGLFLAGRIVQAIAVGITMPMMQVCMVNMFPAKRLGAVMGLYGLVVGLAPAIGPTFAGWIISEDHTVLGFNLSSSWRTVFLLPMVIVGISVALTPFMIRDVVPNRDTRLDFLSFLKTIIGFGAFLWGFTNVASFGWGNVAHVILPIITGFIVIALFARRQLRLEEPLLNVSVFRNRQFALTTVCLALSVMAMMGVEMMLPLYMQTVRGLSAFDAGLVLLPGALMMGIISPLAGRAYDAVGAKVLVLTGFFILALGTVPFVFFTPTTPEHFVTVLYGMRMFGIAMCMMPLTASAMKALPTSLAAHGTASNATARQVASAVVVALLSSVAQNLITGHQPDATLQGSNPLEYAHLMLQAALDGYRMSFLLGLVFAVMGMIFINFLRQHGQQPAKEETLA